MLWHKVQGAGGLAGGTDADAAAYIAAVEAADGQALEEGVKTAINDFVVGCKEDGTWDALKACCILAGARTLDGALVPLVGPAPTNNNFESSDYDRKTGLAGSPSNNSKYLDANRDNNAEPQNSKHYAVYATSFSPIVDDNNVSPLIAAFAGSTSNSLSQLTAARQGSAGFPDRFFIRVNQTSGPVTLSSPAVGFIAVDRGNGSSVVLRNNGSDSTLSSSSSPPASLPTWVFRRQFSSSSQQGAGRLSFYSIGESLGHHGSSLSNFDSRVSTLMSDLNGAIA